MRISVVIPCYRSPSTLEKQVTEIDRLLAGIEEVEDFEIVLALDTSDKVLWRRIKIIANQNSRVVGVRLSQNFGQHQAIAAGITQSIFDLIITLDDDGQHPPSEIIKLLQQMNPEVDLVYGHATMEEHNFFRNLSSRVSKAVFQHLLGIEHAKDFSAFRFFRKSICSIEDLQYDMGTSLDIYLTGRTDHILCVPVDMSQRSEGKSNYSLKQLFKYALGIVISSSRVPLKFMTFIGVSGALVAGLASLVMFLRWFLWDISIPGYTSLFLMLGFLTSINCISLGILGEYLGSVHKKVSHNPVFIVREVTSAETL